MTLAGIRAEAVVVAGGKGVRMGAGCRKQYLEIGGAPILSHTIAALDRVDAVSRVILVVPEPDLDFCRSSILPCAGLRKELILVPGGKERQESVYAGLQAVSAGCELVLIHDGVRPCVSRGMIENVLRIAAEKGACVPVLPVVDTVKVSGDGRTLDRTAPRDGLFLSQTPQAFHFPTIMTAHRNAVRTGYLATDDSELMEKMGHTVFMVPGERTNIKITRPEDLPLAALYLQAVQNGIQI